ncbi:beta-propeller fold lactonase family protein [Mucilaginibacter sp.]|uniref:beta-propeller fold lactonase family protein n=1 Tax=Mucilaginibacter sp. TaxID=1882438 RepID=UPI0025E0D8BF|nr:beta-propeller fold lactonase family protein [Mucilaginibacter sp.]
MTRLIYVVALTTFFFSFLSQTSAQSNQTVTNGDITAAANFPGAGCNYTWVNNNPFIGLPASGSGNIQAFTAINSGNVPVTATITATPTTAGFAYIFSTIGQLTVIDLSTNQIINNTTTTFHAFGETISPDGKFIYVTDPSNNAVITLNATTYAIEGYTPTGNNSAPRGITISPDGNNIYVTNEHPFDILGHGTVDIINTATHNITATIAVGESPLGIVLSPDGSKLYVANQGSNFISVINANTGVAIGKIPLDQGVSSLAITHDGSQLYITGGGASVSVISTATNQLIKTIGVGLGPIAMTISSDDKKVYVVNEDLRSVSVIDNQTKTVIATIDLPGGQSPFSIYLSPDGTKAYAVNQNGVISVINTANNSVTNSITTVTGALSYGNFVSAGPGCSSSPVTFTITVKPTAAVPLITAGPVSGEISTCAGSPSALPYIQQFTATCSKLAAAVTVAAPKGFEVSLSPGNGYSSSLTLAPSGGSLKKTIYVRSAAADNTGDISGSVILSSAGAANQSVAVAGVVNALPTVNIVPNQTVNNGALTKAVDFTGTGSTFTWTNNTPGIGLAASGTGNISPFTAVNTGSTPVTANITVTPIPRGFAYITNLNDNTVSVINTTTYKIVSTIPVGKQPIGVAISKDGQTVYVTNLGSNNISVISASSNTVTSTINVGQGPYQAILSPDDSKLYVSNPGGNTISEINIATGTVINTFLVGANPNGIRLSADGTYLYAASALTSNVYVINTATNALIATIPVGVIPMDLVISPDGSRVYVISAGSTDISVINTVNNTLIKTIHVGTNLQAICISPDGSKIYISDIGNNEILVYDTATYDLITSIPVGYQPEGISLTPDGSRLYTANQTSNTVSVINTQDNAVINTIPVGNAPASIGKFISAGFGCVGTPTTFTITVNPLSTPSITASTVTGNIIGCEGLVSPNIQQFTVSGSRLTANITATAPLNFEISLNATTGYSSSLTLTQTSGTVSNTIIYVRSSAIAPAGSISSNVHLTSTGATIQPVVVSGIIKAIPTVNAVISQILTSGAPTSPVNFSGTATTYNWVNDTPGVGLASNGTGNIPSFASVNNTANPIIATIMVTPLNSTNCNGTPILFTITVSPKPIPATLTTTANLTPLATIYGTPSTAESFGVSGTNISGGILVTPTTGFEVSSNGTAFNTQTTINGNGSISSAPVYVRLAATTPVGNYSGNIAVSTNNTTSVNVLIPISRVSPAPLTITANNQTKPYGAVNPALTVTYLGFVNNDGPGQLSSQPTITTTATTQSPIAQYPILASDAVSPNYTFTYLPGILTIEPSLSLLSIPNTFTPNGDGINDTWDVKYLDYYPKATVIIFNRWGEKVFSSVGYPIPWDGTYKGTALSSGTYYYIIDPKNEQSVFSGWLAIIR